MKNLFLFFEVGNLGGLVLFFVAIMLGPPVLLGIIALVLFSKQKKKPAKIFLILAGIYLVVGLGICGALMN